MTTIESNEGAPVECSRCRELEELNRLLTEMRRCAEYRNGNHIPDISKMVSVKREDLDEAIWELNEWSGSGPCRHSSNVDKLLTRLRAAKEGA